MLFIPDISFSSAIFPIKDSRFYRRRASLSPNIHVYQTLAANSASFRSSK